jgi:hypothetical protein
MYIAYSSTSSCPRLLLLGTEDGTKYMHCDAPRLSSDLCHLHVNDMFDCWESQGFVGQADVLCQVKLIIMGQV